MGECLVCGKSDFKTLLEFEKAPKDIQGLLKKEDLERDTFISFDLIQCTNCETTQLSEFDNIAEDYYDDYLMAQTCSPHSKQYSKSLAERFVEKYDLKGKKLFEIGCGDGEFLLYCKELGVDCLGIEPSQKFADEATSKGLDVRVEYFDDSTPLEPKSFDAFASRAVFEHLKNPNEILRNVMNVLREGGIGMIEVPSYEKAIKDRRYYDFFSDHVAYYTKRTLMTLLELNGFEILEAFNEFEEEYVVVVFRKNSAYNEKTFLSEFEAYRKEFRMKLDDMQGRVVIWGAGGKGNAVLSLCNITSDDVAYVIDSDEHKIGRYTIGHHLEIKDPDILEEDTPDVIIISAMAFHDEIFRTLKEKFNFSGDVYVISPRLRKIQ